MLLPTIHKDEVSHKMAYPVGAELISRFAGATPRAAQVNIWFNSNPVYWASEFNKILRDGTEYVVLKALMRWDGPHVDGVSDNIKWLITVYPVSRELKFVAKQGLMADALPKLQEWLTQTSTSEGRRKVNSSFTAFFDPVEKTVRVI